MLLKFFVASTASVRAPNPSPVWSLVQSSSAAMLRLALGILVQDEAGLFYFLEGGLSSCSMKIAVHASARETPDCALLWHLPNIKDRGLRSGHHPRHHLLFAYLATSAAFIILLIRPSYQYSHLQPGYCLPSSKTSTICARTSLVSPLLCSFKPYFSQTLLFILFFSIS